MSKVKDEKAITPWKTGKLYNKPKKETKKVEEPPEAIIEDEESKVESDTKISDRSNAEGDVNDEATFEKDEPGMEETLVEDEAREISDLSASWLEFIFGIKAELFANIYIGGSIRLGFLISEKEPENFKNLYIPGFNKVTDDSNFGVGYNVSLSYFIPFYKKKKKTKEFKKEVEKEQ